MVQSAVTTAWLHYLPTYFLWSLTTAELPCGPRPYMHPYFLLHEIHDLPHPEEANYSIEKCPKQLGVTIPTLFVDRFSDSIYIGVLVECDPSIKAIILKIDQDRHNYIVEDLDDQTLVIKEDQLSSLKARLEEVTACA